jgi:hypothetical protein
MEHLQMTRSPTGVHVEGFPDADRIVRVETGGDARRLADMGAHLTDLEFARECLRAINETRLDQRIIRTALWRSAIVHFAKCFGDNNARGQLTRAQVYGAKEQNSKLVFDYFINLRRKHVVHDDNGFLQTIPIAVVNKEGVTPRIPKVACATVVADTLDQSHWANLDTLITRAIVYVAEQVDELCARIAIRLEAEDRKSLATYPTFDQLSIPAASDVGSTRARIPQ